MMAWVERHLKNLIMGGFAALSIAAIMASNAALASTASEKRVDLTSPKLPLPFFAAAFPVDGMPPGLPVPPSGDAGAAGLSAGFGVSSLLSVSLPLAETATEASSSAATYWKRLGTTSFPSGKRDRSKFAVPRDVLGSVTLLIANAPLTQRWRAVLQERADSYFEGECQAEWATCGSRLRQQLIETVAVARQQDDQAAIRSINAAVNARLKYRSDLDNYGVPDYWATAGELLQRGAGDCKGYAILKMWMLRAAGFDRSQLRLQLVKIPATGQDHAILVVNTAAGQIVLDNIAPGARTDTDVKEYKPLLSFIEGQTYIHGMSRKASSS